MHASVRVIPWTAAEDEMLLELIEEHGKSHWKRIGEEFRVLSGSARTNIQCRERFFNHLFPGLTKGSWTHEEEETLFYWHRVHANQWSKISKHLPGRTENSIKCFFNSAVKKAVKEFNATHSTPCTRSHRALVSDPHTTILLGIGEGSKQIVLYHWYVWWMFFKSLQSTSLNYS